MLRRHRPQLLVPGAPPVFPDPREADEEGLVAIGGDLTPERILAAYDVGIFPWFDEGLPPLWWSPHPRAVIELSELHVSRSMRRELHKARFQLSFDRAFTDVMRLCAERDDAGTWIFPEMIEAYSRLYELGHAHSFEVWHEEHLVGGLYGVHRGGLFAAESMFHLVTNASKVALIASVRSLCASGIELYDVQFLTPHLASLGAREIPRSEYLARLDALRDKPVTLRGLQLSVD